MVRTRLAFLALPLFCIFSAGCMSTSNSCGDNRGFFARLFSPREKECCEMMPTCSCCSDGPMLGDSGMMMGTGTLPYPTPLPLTQPPMNPPARISPVPQSQPQAYQPTSRSLSDFPR